LKYHRAHGFEAGKRLNFMQWIAPSEKDTSTDRLEKRLWDAADLFRLKKFEVRSPRCEVESVRHSTLGIRHSHRLPVQARFDYLLKDDRN
jgi:hypothetical protein